MLEEQNKNCINGQEKTAIVLLRNFGQGGEGPKGSIEIIENRSAKYKNSSVA